MHVCVHINLNTHASQSAYIVVKVSLMAVSSLLPLCETRGIELMLSGFAASPLHTAPSYWPSFTYV